MESSEPIRGNTTLPAGGFRNIYGRRGGRGMRPFLIVLKLLLVCAFIGGLVSVLVTVAFVPPPQDLASWRGQASFLARTFVYVIVPGLTGALVLGALLMAGIWRVMIRMRWLQVKLAIVFLAMPGLHLFMELRSITLRAMLAEESPDLVLAATLRGQLLVGTWVTLVLGIILLILGRVKPRLGQDYGKTFAKLAN